MSASFDWELYPHLHGRIYSLYVEDEYRWLQGYNAKDESGTVCSWKDENIAGFCLLGAVYKVYKKSAYWNIICEYLNQIFGGFWEGPLINWNDSSGRTYEEVIIFLEKYKL